MKKTSVTEPQGVCAGDKKSPARSITQVFQTFMKVWKTAQRGEKTFSTRCGTDPFGSVPETVKPAAVYSLFSPWQRPFAPQQPQLPPQPDLPAFFRRMPRRITAPKAANTTAATTMEERCSILSTSFSRVWLVLTNSYGFIIPQKEPFVKRFGPDRQHRQSLHDAATPLVSPTRLDGGRPVDCRDCWERTCPFRHGIRKTAA